MANVNSWYKESPFIVVTVATLRVNTAVGNRLLYKRRDLPSTWTPTQLRGRRLQMACRPISDKPPLKARNCDFASLLEYDTKDDSQYEFPLNN